MYRLGSFEFSYKYLVPSCHIHTTLSLYQNRTVAAQVARCALTLLFCTPIIDCVCERERERVRVCVRVHL